MSRLKLGMNRLALLGSIQITRNGESVRGFESRKALALLCYLAIRAQPVSRVELANLFWGDKTETQGRGNLSRVLNNLSALFPDSFETNRETVQLKRGAFAVDCAEFDAATDDERRKTDLETVVRHLSSVVPFYRGEFMSGMFLDDCPEFELWLVQERERWQQRIVSVLDCLSGHHARRGEFANALPFAARLLEIEPWREETHREMMKLLAQTNQRSAALQQYETARRVLKEELNVEPGAETNALYEKIRAEEIAPPKTPPHNLPAQLTTFFGRETELTRIAARLNNPDCRLLTLVGAGGMGKTRLALEAAKHVLNSFRDGVYFVPLASIGAGQTQFIVPAMANALNLPLTGQQEPKTQVLNFLRDKQILLLLDNFEHLLDGGELVIEILQHAPKAKIFVTSREPLNVQAEWTMRVEGLNFPTAAPRKLDELLVFSATRLFVERAQRVSDGFELNSETAPHVIRLAQIVEGMPLALELAAARTRTLRVHEIRAQVEQNFDVLATTMRDVESRHRSMYATIAWSYSLLNTLEQKLFRHLAVFAESWSTQAAIEIAQDVPREQWVKQEPPFPRDFDFASLPALQELVDKSLVIQEQTLASTRYRFHPAIQQFALAQLEQEQEVNEMRRRFVRWYFGFCKPIPNRPPEIDQARWLERVDVEYANVRAALLWGMQQNDFSGMMVEMVVDLWSYWFRRAFINEGRYWFIPALERVNAATPLYQTKLWLYSAAQAYRQADYTTAWQRLEHGTQCAIEINDDAMLAQAKRIRGNLFLVQHEYAAARAEYLTSLALCRAAGDMIGIAMSLSNLGSAATGERDYAAAQDYLRECLQVYREMNDKVGMAYALHLLGNIARVQEDYVSLRELNEQSLELKRQVQDRWGIANSLEALGTVALWENDTARAQQLFGECLAIFNELDDKLNVALALEDFAALANHQRASMRAAQLLGSAHAMRQSIGSEIAEEDRPRQARVIQTTQKNLPAELFQTAWNKGYQMTPEQAIEFALYDNADAKN